MKKVMLAAGIFVLALALAGCGAKLDPEIAQGAEAKAQEVVTCISQGDYQSVTDMAREDLREALSPEALAQALDPILAEAGDFVELGKYASTGSTDKNSGEVYAVVAAVGVYANDKLTYTISFDLDLALTGLYVK